MAFFIDQTERRITLNKTPQRIISLVPSQTELLFDLGLTEQVIGITKFCVHPDEWFQTKTRIGGTKQLKIEIIKQLRPDLIIANKEENVKEQVEELQNYFPVWISDVNNLDDAYEMIEQIGLITNKQDQATKILFQIKENFAGLETCNLPAGQAGSKLTACYLIWQNPYMTIGGDTFINSLLEAAGFENMFVNKKRYPEVTIDELIKLNPEILLLSSEPFPFKQKHADELQAQLPNTKIVIVDGEMFSWYGSRLLKAPAYFKQLLNEIIDNN
jgi:ABC-type Fe3+-hydroxamate transport system substrate-binding protein